MSVTRLVGSLTAAAFAVGVSVWVLAADEKKKKEPAGDYVQGNITGITKDYEFKDPDDPKKVLLHGTKIDLKAKVKKKTGQVGNPWVVLPERVKPEFETADKELAVGQYAKIWFDNGDKDPNKQGEALKIVVIEDPALKKKKKAAAN